MVPPVLRLRERNVAENVVKNAATWSRNKFSLQRRYDGFNFNVGFLSGAHDSLFLSKRAGSFAPRAVMLTRRDALQHLLRLGLLTPDDVVAQDITASEYIGRNHLVRVERPGAPCYIVKQPTDVNKPDASTMWTEAAIFWLSVNNAEFAVMAPWMPRYYHY